MSIEMNDGLTTADLHVERRLKIILTKAVFPVDSITEEIEIETPRTLFRKHSKDGNRGAKLLIVHQE